MIQEFNQVSMVPCSGKGDELLADSSDHATRGLTLGALGTQVAINRFARAYALVPSSQRSQLAQAWKPGWSVLVDGNHLK